MSCQYQEVHKEEHPEKEKRNTIHSSRPLNEHYSAAMSYEYAAHEYRKGLGVNGGRKKSKFSNLRRFDSNSNEELRIHEG